MTVMLTCQCGGRAWTRDELVALGTPDTEGMGYEAMWRSLLGPFDLYCSDDDDVLTEEEAWTCRGLRMPGHDHDENEDAWFAEGHALL